MSLNLQQIKKNAFSYYPSLLITLSLTLVLFFAMSKAMDERNNITYEFYELSDSQALNTLYQFRYFSGENIRIKVSIIKKYIRSVFDTQVLRSLKELDVVNVELRGSSPTQVRFYNLSDRQVEEVDVKIREALQRTRDEIKNVESIYALNSKRELDNRLKYIRDFASNQKANAFLDQAYLETYLQLHALSASQNDQILDKLFSKIVIKADKPKLGVMYYALALCLGFLVWAFRVYFKEYYK